MGTSMQQHREPHVAFHIFSITSMQMIQQVHLHGSWRHHHHETDISHAHLLSKDTDSSSKLAIARKKTPPHGAFMQEFFYLPQKLGRNGAMR
jgi:hypothetical protein